MVHSVNSSRGSGVGQLIVWAVQARNKRLDRPKLVEWIDSYVLEDLTIKQACRLIDELKAGTLSERN